MTRTTIHTTGHRGLRRAAALGQFWLLRGAGEAGRARRRGALERGGPALSRARTVAPDWPGSVGGIAGGAGHATGLPLPRESTERPPLPIR
jgi:hypothetical protein